MNTHKNFILVLQCNPQKVIQEAAKSTNPRKFPSLKILDMLEYVRKSHSNTFKCHYKHKILFY